MRQSTLSAFGPPRPTTAPPIDARPPLPLPYFDQDLSNRVEGGATADIEGDPEWQGKEMTAPALPPSDNDQRLHPAAQTMHHGGPEIGTGRGQEAGSDVSSWLPRPGPSSSSGEAAPTRSRRAAATRSEAQSRQMTLALNGALALERKAALSFAGREAGDYGEEYLVETGSGGVGAANESESVPKRGKRGRPRKDEAAKDKAREINLVDDDEEDEEGKKKMEEARNRKKKEKEREQEKEMSLQVKGNGSSDGKVHSFFAKRLPRPPAEEQTKDVAAANQNAFFVAGNGSSSKAAAPSSLVKKRPLMDARWPRTEEMLVEPPPQVQDVLPWSRQFNWPKKEPKDRIHNGLAPEELQPLPWQHRAGAHNKGRNEGGRSPVTSSKLHPGQLEELVASSANTLPSGSSTKLAGKGLTQNRSTKTNEAWTDRWRPLKADEVLGNEVGATYLRDWIHQLQVSPTASVRSTAETEQSQNGLSSSPGKNKKRTMQVQKRAEKKRRKKAASRRGGLDGFLVDDDDGEDQVGSWDEGDDEESAWFDQFRTKNVEDLVATANVDEPDETLFASSDRLANVLVLTGPTGSGKTASVYACASELNHEVFEIYPGMGKRSGKELSTAVGDLGRNHMVSSGGTGGGATWKMLDRKETTTISSNGHSTKPRQSVILIEEVDLLYDEDKGFWAAVVELVAESRRPVILTCNDLSAVPLSDLPIQRVLTFRPPPASIAVPYLQLLCAHEGYLVERADLERLYASTQGLEMDRAAISQLTFTSDGRDGGPVNPRMQLNAIDKLSDHESFAALDLRQAINQLQFECQGSCDSTANTHPAKAAAPSCRRLMPQQLENRSFFDASIEAPFDRASELLEPDRYLPFATHDELQLPNEMVALPKMKPRPIWAAFPTFAREDEYRSVLAPWNSDEEELLLGRLTTSRKVDEVLGCRGLCLAPSWSAFLGSDHCITDYTSHLCRMVAIDDVAQAQHAAELARAQEEALKRRQALFEEASAVSGGSQRQLDEEALQSASFSLAKIGIRSTRGSTQMILSGSSEGPGDFVRLLDLDKPILERIREVGSFSM